MRLGSFLIGLAVLSQISRGLGQQVYHPSSTSTPAIDMEEGLGRTCLINGIANDCLNNVEKILQTMEHTGLNEKQPLWAVKGILPSDYEQLKKAIEYLETYVSDSAVGFVDKTNRGYAYLALGKLYGALSKFYLQKVDDTVKAQQASKKAAGAGENALKADKSLMTLLSHDSFSALEMIGYAKAHSEFSGQPLPRLHV